MIRFACSTCGQNLMVPSGGASTIVRCPQCRTQLEVPAVYQGGTPPIRSVPVMRPERAIIDVVPEPRMGLPEPIRPAPSGTRETTMGESERDEGVLEEQELSRPRMPAGTKVAILLLSFVVVMVLLTGALLLIRDAAIKEEAERKRKERPEGTPSGNREISRNSRENDPPYRRPVFSPPPIQQEKNHNASARRSEQRQFEEGKDGPLPSSPKDTKDIEDSPKQGRALAPRLEPWRLPDSPRENSEANPETVTDTRSPEAREIPAKDYEPACEAARTKLLKGFDAAIDALAKKTAPVEERLKWVDMVKKEKERYEIGGLIPWSEPMRPHVDQYLNSLTAAQKNLKKVYDSVIDKELRARNDKEVDRLRSERKKRLDVKAMARWRHIVYGREPGVIHTLYSNGKIDAGNATWNYAKGELHFNWPLPGAPGLFSVDQLFIRPEGTTYEGTNIDKPERKPSLSGVYVPAGNQSRQLLAKGFLNRVHKDSDGNEAKYMLFVPHFYSNEAKNPYPVILFLHGSEQSGTDGKKQVILGLAGAIKNRESTFPFFVIFPQSQKRTWQADSGDAKRALDILGEVEMEYKIDRKRVYLTGLSMGGIGTWNLAIAHPEKWAAIVPICGRGDASKAEAIKDLPCWCFHGDADWNVPVEGSREMIDAMIKAGGKPKYTEYPGVGHNSWDRAYRTPELYTWLLTQHKK